MKVRAAGDAALLLETGAGAPDQDGNGAATVAALIRAADLPGVIDVVPGAVTVLVSVEPGSWSLAGLAARLTELASAAAAVEVTEPGGAEIIDVCYDGPDLADVASLTGLSVAEVIARHQAAAYRVGWLGFAPGFAYLTGLDPLLAAVPRLDSPRQRVPAGSVAIAGGLAAVYPAASPGGWRLLGRTTARLWEPDRDPPALLAPGTRVRFRAVDSLPTRLDRIGADRPNADRPNADRPAPDLAAPAPAARPTTGAARRVEVLQPGPLTTVQDLGRAGLAHLGVPASGAADAGSLRLANSLVGNDAGAACLEVTLGRLHCGSRVPPWSPSLAPSRQSASAMTSSLPTRRSRSRLGPYSGSARRTPACAATSRSTAESTSGRCSAAGRRTAFRGLGLGPCGRETGCRSNGPVPFHRWPATTAAYHRARRCRTTGTAELRVIAGPRDDWFGAPALDALAAGSFVVTRGQQPDWPAADRAGAAPGAAR